MPVALALALACFACSSAKKPAGAPPSMPNGPMPTIVTSWKSGLAFQPVNQPVTLTVTMTLPDGSPLPDGRYDVLWPVLSGKPHITESHEHPSPGVYTATYASTYPEPLLIYVEVEGKNGGQPLVLPQEWIEFWGGKANAVYPLVKDVSLLVGESRPAASVALAPLVGDAVNVVTADTPVTYAVADPAIADVNANGWVTAKAAGKTILTATAGAAHADVPVTVTVGTPAPPPEGVTEVYAGIDVKVNAVANGLITFPMGSVEARLAVDARGYPAAVAIATKRLLLLSWTGSGYGAEIITTPEEQPWGVYAPSVAVDERDHVYVVWIGLRGQMFVSDRPTAATGPAPWRTRELDPRIPEDAGKDDPAAMGLAVGERMAIEARRGGGIWAVAFSSRVAPVAQAGTLGLTRLYEVTDDAIGTSDVDRTTFMPEMGRDPFLGLNLGGYAPSSPLQLLPQGPGETTPRVLSFYPIAFGGGLVAYAAQAGKWTATTLAEPVLQTKKGPLPLTYFSVARAVVPGEPSQVLAGWYDAGVPTSDSYPPTINWKVVDGGRGQTWTQNLNKPPKANHIHAFRGAGVTYLGGESTGPLKRLRDFLDVDDVLDDPAEAEGMTEVGSNLFGETNTAGRLYHSMLYAPDVSKPSVRFAIAIARLVAHTPTPTDSELVGTRIDSGNPPDLFSRDGSLYSLGGAPAVLANGSRYVMTAPSNSALSPGSVLRSAGPGQPFLPRAARQNRIQGSVAGQLGAVRQLYASTSGLYGLAEYDNRPLVVVGSTDEAQTFKEVTRFDPGVIPVAVAGKLITPAGALWVATINRGFVDVWLAPDLSTGAAPQKLPGLGSSATDPPSQLPHSVGFVPLPGGNVLMATVSAEESTRPDKEFVPRLLLQVLSATGTLVRQAVVNAQDSATALDWTVFPEASVALADGTVLMDEIKYATDALGTGIGWWHRIIRVSPDLVATVGPQLSPDAWGPVASLVALKDGRAALASTHPATPTRFSAFYATSTDGMTWSAPRDLLPKGGAGQICSGMAVEPGGGLAAVVYDNAAITQAMGAGWDFRGDYESALYPVAPEQVFIEVPTP